MPIFSPCSDEVFDGLFCGSCAGAHQDDDALGIGCADVVEQVVAAAGLLGEAVHHVLHDGGAGQVVRIAGFARLEEYVGILRRAAKDRTVGAECALAVCDNRLVVKQWR